MTPTKDYASMIDEILSDLPARSGSDEFRPGRIAIDDGRRRLADPEDVRDRIRDFDSLSGWIQTTSHVVPSEQLHRAEGHILCAELANHSESLHVRQDGTGGWIVCQMETIDGDGLICEKEFLARKPFGTLRYQVAWQQTETEDGFDEWRPYVARLVHFETGE